MKSYIIQIKVITLALLGNFLYTQEPSFISNWAKDKLKEEITPYQILPTSVFETQVEIDGELRTIGLPIRMEANGKEFIFKLPDNLRAAGRFTVSFDPDAYKNSFNSNNFYPQKKHLYKKLGPDQVRYKLFEANNFFNKKEYDKAMAILREIEKSEPKNFKALNMIGALFYEIGWNEDAIEYWKRSLEINSDQPAVKKFIQSKNSKKQ